MPRFDESGDDPEKAPLSVAQGMYGDDAWPSRGPCRDDLGKNQPGLRIVAEEGKIGAVDNIRARHTALARGVKQVAVGIENPQAGELLEIEQTGIQFGIQLAG